MLVSPEKRLKVVDFGIARALASIQEDEKYEVVWGSPQYFSPEQASGSAPLPASDVYSLGVVMYEMLTGRLPFSANTPEELARLHREAPAPSPRRINPAIPVSLERILLKVLSKEPASRYRTADQLGRVLVTFTQQSPVAVAPVGPAYPEHSEAGDESPLNVQGDTSPVQTMPALTYSDPPQRGYLPRQPVAQIPDQALDNPLDLDWVTWLLGLLALIAVGGLIPFFLWVYYVLNPPT
jgi:serine/threonine-protein kinase